MDANAHLASFRVLVVDDNPVNLMITSAMLSTLRITPLLAADGAQAAALASELPLDLILMDLQMPVLDGRAAARQIRRAEHALARHRVPILAYTSSSPTAKPTFPTSTYRDGTLRQFLPTLPFAPLNRGGRWLQLTQDFQP